VRSTPSGDSAGGGWSGAGGGGRGIEITIARRGPLTLPIGLPRVYAEAVFPDRDFRKILESLDQSFFEPSDEPERARPFGPKSSTKGIFGPLKLAEKLKLSI